MRLELLTMQDVCPEIRDRRNAMAIMKLGHTGLWVYDLPKMRDFYERIVGLTVTDEDPDLGIVFFSSRPEEEHHEFVLQEGRTSAIGDKQQHQRPGNRGRGNGQPEAGDRGRGSGEGDPRAVRRRRG